MNRISQVIAAVVESMAVDVNIGSAGLTVAGQAVTVIVTAGNYIAIGTSSLVMSGQEVSYTGGTRVVIVPANALVINGQAVTLKATVNIGSVGLLIAGVVLNTSVDKPYGLGFTPASLARPETRDLVHDPCGHWHDSAQAGEQKVFDFVEQEDKRWNWFDGSWNKFKTGG